MSLVKVTHDQGEENGGKRPAIKVADNGDGTAILFSPEGDSSDVKCFPAVPLGTGGNTYST